MATYTVELRRVNSGETRVATVEAEGKGEAIAKAAKKFLGTVKIGLVEHFPGGDTSHVQFSYGRAGNLTGKYVAHTTKED